MRLAGMCVAAVMLVGCGAEDAAEDVREAVDPVAQAADKMAASGGARVDGDMTVRTTDGDVPMILDGKVSFEDGEGQFFMDFGEIEGASAKDMEAARREAGFPIRTITAPGETYFTTPRVVEEGREDGVRWLKLDHEEVDEEGDLDVSGISQMSEVNPEAMLKFLKTVADARETGTKTIDGVVATRYSATVDIRDYPKTVEPEQREAAERTVDLMVRAWGSPTHDVDVWIDADGLIRREVMRFTLTEAGERMRAKLVLDFLDVGKPQEIEVPDGDEVYDISEELADHVN